MQQLKTAADNALILFDKNQEEYPLIVTDYEGIRRIRTVSQIMAEGAEDIAITGNGIINGNGHLWRPVKQFKMTERQWKRLLTQSEYVIDSKEGGVWVPTKSIYDTRYEGEVFPDTSVSLRMQFPKEQERSIWETSRRKNEIKTAVIGVGNMVSRYAALVQDGRIDGLELAALTRVRGTYRDMLLPSIEAGIPVYESADDLFGAMESGEPALDAVIIATPHYAHEELAVRAFRNGLHVLCDKPSGVYSRQARVMEETAAETGRVFGMVFNQRVLPVHKQLHDLVRSGKYGALKRVNWVVTDWYRPDQYYTSSSWHATWDKDGGGVLLNQCPHNLDLLQWICGMPVRVQGFCHEGHFHDIEVEDDVTAYLEWENGATGTFITSTGDAPGINRLEISLEEAMIVCEGGKLRIGELQQEMGCKEAEYRAASTDFFRKIKGTWQEIVPPKEEDPYQKVLQGFADACLERGANIAPGTEGRKSLLIGNAIYLSSWEHRMVELPQPGTQAELVFEKLFEKHLQEKRSEK